jgi:AraC-like DNA-binding protein
MKSQVLKNLNIRWLQLLTIQKQMYITAPNRAVLPAVFTLLILKSTVILYMADKYLTIKKVLCFVPLNSNLSINEIAYEPGFEYPQIFSKFFKKKVGVSPTLIRAV